MKKLIKNVLNKFGLEIKKIDKEIKNIDFNTLLKNKISNKNPIIFDVGANQGQTIEKYLKLFNQPTIHSFEPIKSEFEYMAKKFNKNKNIFLNNFALGNKIEEKEFNVTKNTSNSSFNKINTNSNWLEVRSKQFNTTKDSYVKNIQKVKVDTLDNYCTANKIDNIDLLKIDTQGYEDKVLEGCFKTIQNNKIKAIVTEIMFDNVYDKYFSFSDIEKYIIPNGFRMVGIELSNNNLFSGLVFFADVMYFSKKYYNI